MFSSKARLWLLLLLVILVGPVAYAQTVTVTASGVVDPNGNLYSNGTISAFLVTSSGTIPKVGTAPVNPALGPFPVDGTASFSVQVTPNAIILPGGTQWVFTVCGTSVNLGPQPQPLLQVCFNSPLITVTSPGPQDITAQLNAVAKILGPKTGGGGGGGGSGTVGPGTINTVSKFVTPTQVGNSSVTDNGVAPTREPNGNNTATSGDHDEWTVDAGGTIAGRLVCVTGNRLVQTCGLGATSGIVGVADSTVAAGGTVSVCWAAKCNVTAATPTVVNDWLVASVTVAGEADDVGATKPSNTQAFPADSTVLAGQNVLSTLLSLDTINAQISGSGTVQPCGPGVAYYPGPGVNTIINCIPNPNAPAAVPQLFNATPGGSPGWNLPGVPVSAQVGTNYTWQTTDRLKLITGNNASPTTWTGPALINNFAAAFLNLNAGLITFTPASGQVNGGASQIIPRNWFGLHYTDNANTWMPVLPTLAAFPNCTTALTFTSATGVIGCGGGGIFNINTVATGPNVVIQGVGATAVNTAGNIITISGGTTGNIASTWQNIPAGTYTVPDTDNTFRDRIPAPNNVITLPQPGTITVSPIVQERFAGLISSTSFTSSTYTNVAGNQQLIWVRQGSPACATTAISDTTGDLSLSNLVSTASITGGGQIDTYYIPNLVGGVAITTTVSFGSCTPTGFATPAVAGVELTGTTHDNTLSAVCNVGPSCIVPLTNPIHFQNAVAIAAGVTGGAFPSYTSFENIFNNGNFLGLFFRLLTNQNSISSSYTGNHTQFVQTILSVSSHPSYVAGWLVTIENASTGPVPVASVAAINGQSGKWLAPNEACTFESNGTSWDAICGWMPNVQTNGVNGAIYAADQTAGTTSIGATTIYSPAASPAPVNRYVMSGRATVTVVGSSCAGNTTVVMNTIYTDPLSAGGTTTIPMGTFTVTTNGTVGVSSGNFAPTIFEAKPGTNIQFSTTYTAGGSCSPAPTVQVTPILQVM